MKILHVIPHFYPATRYGGPIRSVRGLASASASLGDEVHVFTTNVDGPGVTQTPVGAPAPLDGFAVWYFATGLGRRVYRSPDLAAALKAQTPSFDVVHIHYVWTWPTIAAARAAERAGVPYVLAPRGMLVADLIRRKNALAKRLWLRLFDRRTVERASALHVTTEAERRDVEALGLRTPRIVVIPNGVSPAPTGGSAATAPERPFVLFLGRINWKKGLDRLIPAMAQVGGLDLVVAGYDEGSYAAEMAQLATACGVSDRVRFIGPVDGAEKWALIRAARLMATPSHHENFGMSVVEAMAAGRPVVVTPEVGLADAVAQAGAGLVCDGAPDALGAAIERISQDPEAAARMGEAGRRLVAGSFQWDAIARRTRALYAELVTARAGRA